MTEAIRGLSPRDISPAFIAATRDSVFDAITEEGLSVLRRLSQFSPRKDSLSPGAYEFETLPAQTQHDVRRWTASVALKAMRGTIKKGLSEGVLDRNSLYNETSVLLEGTTVRNPFAKPTEPPEAIPSEELETMRKIADEDPTFVRFFNKGLRNLPHIIRREFRRLGVTLIFIQNELVPEAAQRMEKEGVPRTHGKKTVKKVEVAPEHPFGTDRHQMLERQRNHTMRRRRIRSRRRRGSIWPTY